MRLSSASRLLLLSALAAVGCAPAPAGVAPGGASAGRVTVTSRLGVQARDGYKLMTETAVPGVSAYTRDDVAYLMVYLTRVGDQQQEVSLGRFDLGDAPLKIENLRMSTSYIVRLEAYQADGNQIDANADDPDADPYPEGCETSFTTTNVEALDLTAEMNPFKVRLLDQAYSGTASGSVEVTPGDVVGPEAAERLVASDAPPPALVDLFELTNVGGDGAITDGPGAARTLALGAEKGNTFKSTFQLPVDVTQSKQEFFDIAFDALPADVRLTFAVGTEAAIDADNFGALPRCTAMNLAANQLALERSDDGTSALMPVDFSRPSLMPFNVNHDNFYVRMIYNPAQPAIVLGGEIFEPAIPANVSYLITISVSGATLSIFDKSIVVPEPVAGAAYAFGLRLANEAASPVTIKVDKAQLRAPQ